MSYLLMPVAHWRSGITTLTVSPQAGAGAGNVTCDGRVGRQGVDQTFANIRSGTGTAHSETETSLAVYLYASATSNQFQQLRRCIHTFDTRSIPTNAIIHSVTLRLYGYDKLNNIGSFGLVICAVTPQNNADLVNSDYNLTYWPSTEYARISYASWNTGGWNTFTLSTSVINKGGITAIGARLTCDFDNDSSGITWTANNISGIYWRAADYGTNIPELIITYEA